MKNEQREDFEKRKLIDKLINNDFVKGLGDYKNIEKCNYEKIKGVIEKNIPCDCFYYVDGCCNSIVLNSYKVIKEKTYFTRKNELQS